MERQRLDADELARHLDPYSARLREAVLELRDFVLDTAPDVAEAIKFNSLCYYKPDRPWGVIGGNVCMIGVRDDRLLLGFIHGAALPDPAGLLQGEAKAARHIEIRSAKDPDRRAIRQLIREAVRYEPRE
jgi:hypothetical protein